MMVPLLSPGLVWTSCSNCACEIPSCRRSPGDNSTGGPSYSHSLAIYNKSFHGADGAGLASACSWLCEPTVQECMGSEMAATVSSCELASLDGTQHVRNVGSGVAPPSPPSTPLAPPPPGVLTTCTGCTCDIRAEDSLCRRLPEGLDRLAPPAFQSYSVFTKAPDSLVAGYVQDVSSEGGWGSGPDGTQDLAVACSWLCEPYMQERGCSQSKMTAMVSGCSTTRADGTQIVRRVGTDFELRSPPSSPPEVSSARRKHPTLGLGSAATLVGGAAVALVSARRAARLKPYA